MMIQLRQIHFQYTKQQPLFDQLSLQFGKGHVCGLLGKNGAGKSTLLKIIAGLRFPQQGTTEVMGRNSCLRDAETLQQLYYLEEEPFFPHLKIKQYEQSYAPFYPNFNHEQFRQLLDEFEITDLDAYVDRLSLGQKKKTRIAFAIACNTAILLMDEPTNGLDIPSKSIFRRIMAQYSNEERLTIISTHQVRDLHSLLDHVAILDHGHILLNAGMEEITEKLFFGLREAADETARIFYTEETPRGTWQVSENSRHLPSSVNLELLFNAAIENQQTFSAIFNTQLS